MGGPGGHPHGSKLGGFLLLKYFLTCGLFLYKNRRKAFRFREAKPPWSPPGALPLDSAGALPPGPVIGSRSTRSPWSAASLLWQILDPLLIQTSFLFPVSVQKLYIVEALLAFCRWDSNKQLPYLNALVSTFYLRLLILKSASATILFHFYSVFMYFSCTFSILNK